MSLKEQFDTQGYIVVEDILSNTDIERLKSDYHNRLEALIPYFLEQGYITQTFSDLPFEQRLGALMSHATVNLFEYFDISLNIHKPTGPMHLSPAIFNLIRTPKLIDTVEELIGDEILSNPIQHVRIKPPQKQAEANADQSTLLLQTGWHQDLGVTRDEADETDMITVWIAITDATEENGCLMVIPESHREGLTVHCPTNQMTIPEKLLGGQPKPVPVKAGSALILHRLTKHASLPNLSNAIRWSFDLRYQPIGQPTGRDEFPSMVVKSNQHPVMPDFATWQAEWETARQELIEDQSQKATHRWDGDAPVCA